MTTMMILLLFCNYAWSFRPYSVVRSHQLIARRNKIVLTTTCTTRFMKGWWEDDLPNILGINPIEAAIIFGGLYYFYGPTVLYDYARETGKLFSTYAPIVKDISLDLFYEFREYFEEDKERDELRKLGIDVDSTPRRTTNAIERFQNSFQTLSESENKEDSNSDVLTDVLNEPLAREMFAGPQLDAKKRKTKREVLEMRNIDVDQVLASASQKVGSSDSLDAALTESVMAVQGTFATIVEQRKLPTARRVDYPTSAFNQYNFPPDYSESSTANADVIDETPAVPKRSVRSLPVIPSKFQQQMTGEWNQRVLRRDKYGVSTLPMQRTQYKQSDNQKGDVLSEEDTYMYADPWTTSEDEFIDVQQDSELNEAPVAEFNLSKMDFSSILPGEPASQQPNIVTSTSDIPEELTFTDDSASELNIDNAGMYVPIAENSTNATCNLTAVVQSGVELLAEMDRDYSRLREKLLSFLKINEDSRS